jgi:hypothetical protein
VVATARSAYRIINDPEAADERQSLSMGAVHGLFEKLIIA